MKNAASLTMKFLALTAEGFPEEPIHLPDEILDRFQPAFVALHAQQGYFPPWIGYVGVVDGQAIGTCGFKSPPENNRVEIAYFTFPEFEGRGYAAAMAQHLVALAATACPGICVTAQTLPETNASTSILTKLGFTKTRDAYDEEVGVVWEWSLITPAQE